MQVVPFVVLQFTALVLSHSSIDYCQFNCDRNRHTVCLGNYTCLPKNCVPVKQIYEWRVDVIEAHNKYRNHLAIGNDSRGGNSMASNMMILSYDMELEAIAYCWAVRYTYGYDVCRKTLRFRDVGQNIYKGYFRKKGRMTPNRIVRTWYEQIKNMEGALLDNFTAHHDRYRAYRHFTQLVNAKTTHLGCTEVRNLAYSNSLVVCNYGPGGNLEGQPVYLRGAPASHCPIGLKRNKEFMGLCGEVVMPIETYRRGVSLPTDTAPHPPRPTSTAVLCGLVLLLSIKSAL